LGGLEFWFYHHSCYPWDISSFSAELWNGHYSGPADLLEQTSVTAVHYAPCHADYSPTVWCEQNFWGLVNSRMSSGGWPALLGDNTPNPASHSFFSYDFLVWELWIIGGATANDYFIRAGRGRLSAGTGILGQDQDALLTDLGMAHADRYLACRVDEGVPLHSLLT
jgi:hypothetical protein